MFQDGNKKMKLHALPPTSVQGFSPELHASLAALAADGPDKTVTRWNFDFLSRSKISIYHIIHLKSEPITSVAVVVGNWLR